MHASIINLFLIDSKSWTPKIFTDIVGRKKAHDEEKKEGEFYKVKTFTEKPDAEIAKTFVKSGELVSGVRRGTVVAGVGCKVAFLFTGQGSQYVGMGKELYATSEVFKEAIDQCDEHLKKHTSIDLKEVLFGLLSPLLAIINRLCRI